MTALIKKLYSVRDTSLQRNLFGVQFENPVGLAAGFDKDARLIDELACFGFGFIEIGTLTPKGQPGNPKPRLFRLKKDQAIINRMGFNNGGVKSAVPRLKNRKSKVIVGGNIGKNKVTPNENAFSDYLICLEELYNYVDYFVVNVSSPNTPNLRALQEKEPLTDLLNRVREQLIQKPSYKPVLLKIAPDLTSQQLDDIVEIAISTGIDGIIATNTTISREGLQESENQVKKIGAGGLSGKPLNDRSNQVIKYLRDHLPRNFPIIGVGGVMTAEDAVQKLESGADLIQIYTGFIYEGPSIVKNINRQLLSKA